MKVIFKVFVCVALVYIAIMATGYFISSYAAFEEARAMREEKAQANAENKKRIADAIARNNAEREAITRETRVQVDKAYEDYRRDSSRATTVQQLSIQQKTDIYNKGYQDGVAYMQRTSVPASAPTQPAVVTIPDRTVAYNQPTPFPSRTVSATPKNGRDIPSGVMDKIRAKASKDWPDDYQMQVFVINEESDAWRKLNP